MSGPCPQVEYPTYSFQIYYIPSLTQIFLLNYINRAPFWSAFSAGCKAAQTG